MAKKHDEEPEWLTRKTRIDGRLRSLGWEVVPHTSFFRPEKSHHQAVEEYLETVSLGHDVRLLQRHNEACPLEVRRHLKLVEGVLGLVHLEVLGDRLPEDLPEHVLQARDTPQLDHDRGQACDR